MNQEEGPLIGASSSESSSSSPIARYVAVAVVFLALGMGGTLLFVSKRHAAQRPPAETEQKDQGGMAGMPGMEGTPSQGTAKSVYISPQRQQLIGVRTAPIGTATLDASIRTVGTLAYDETRLTQVHTRISGWVDRKSVV